MPKDMTYRQKISWYNGKISEAEAKVKRYTQKKKDAKTKSDINLANKCIRDAKKEVIWYKGYKTKYIKEYKK